MPDSYPVSNDLTTIPFDMKLAILKHMVLSSEPINKQIHTETYCPLLCIMGVHLKRQKDTETLKYIMNICILPPYFSFSIG